MLVAVLGAVFASRSEAAGNTCVWSAVVDGDWSLAANWSSCGVGVPGAGDIAVFDAGSVNATIDVAVTSVGEIRLEGTYTGTVTQANGISVTITTGGALGNGGLSISSGTYNAPNSNTALNNLTVNGPFTQTGGTFRAPAIGTSAGAATVFSVGGNFTFTGGTYTVNSGTLKLIGSPSTIDVGTSPTFNNLVIDTAGDDDAKTVADSDSLNVAGSMTVNNGKLNQAVVPAAGTINHTGTTIIQGATGDGFDGGTGLLVVNRSSGTYTFDAANSGTSGGYPRIDVRATGTATIVLEIATHHVVADWKVTSLGSGGMTVTFSRLVFAAPTSGTLTVDTNGEAYNSVEFGDTDGGNAGEVIVQAAEELLVNKDLKFNDGTLTGTVNATGATTGTVVTQVSTFDGGTGLLKFTGADADTIAFTGSGVTATTGDLPDIEWARTAGGALTLSSTLRTTNDWTVTAAGVVPTPGTSTVVFAAPVAGQTISRTGGGGAALTFNNLTFNATGDARTVTIGSGTTVTATGTTTLTEGDLAITGTLNANGAVTQASTFDGGTGTLTLAGTAATFTGSATTSAGDLPAVEIVKGATALTISGTVRTTKAWTFTSGATTAGSGTVVFAMPGGGQTLTSTAAQTIPNIDVRGQADGNTLTLAGAGALTVGGATFTEGQVAGSFTATGTVTQASTSDGGTGTLTLSGASATLTGTASASAGKLPVLDVQKGANTLTVSGTVRTEKNWTWTSGAVAGTGTVVFAAPAAGLTIAGIDHTLPNVNFNATATGQTTTLDTGMDLTVSSATTLTEGNVAGGIVHAQGDITQASTFDGGSTSLTIDGGGAQTFTGNATTTAGLLPAVEIAKGAGTLTLSTPAGTDRIRTASTWTRTSGTLDAGTSSFVSAGATFSGAQTLNNLEIRAASSVTGSSVLTVGGTLTLTSGNVTATGANVLAIGTTGTISRTDGHVVGNLRKSFPGAGSPSFTYTVGDASVYAPIDLTFTALSGAGDVTASTTGSEHGSIGTSTINTTKSVNRFWTLTNSGTTFTSYDAIFNFVAGDVDAGAATSSFIVGKLDGATWSYPTVGTKTATSTQITGATAFSDFAIGESAAADGSGTIARTPTSVLAGTANEIVFTYTVAAGGMSGGSVTIDIPAGWSDPQVINPVGAGYTRANGSTTGISFTGGVLTVADVTLAAGATLEIRYGDDQGDTAPLARAVASGASTGGTTAPFTTKQKSTSGGTLTAVSSGTSSIAINNSADGSGANVVSPTSVTGGTATQFTFTYTAATGGMNDGRLEIAVPGDWTTPQTATATAAGYTTSTVGSVSFSGGEIVATGITRDAGETVVVKYGDTSGGGPGATPPVVSRVDTFTTQQKSTAGTAVTLSGGSPTITIVQPPSVTLVSPAADSWTKDSTPALTAQFSDPDTGDTGTITFQVCYGADPGCATPDETFSSASGIAIGANGTASPTGALPEGDNYWRAKAVDNTTRESAYSSPIKIKVDTALPTQVLSITSVSTGDGSGGTNVGVEAFKVGNTIYYRGLNAGEVKVRSTVTDPLSGPDSATFNALGGTTTNFTFANGTVTTGDPGPYDSATVSWADTTTTSPTMGVFATDFATNDSATTTLTFTNDSVAPAGSITAPGAAANVGGTGVSVTSDSADAGSDVRSAQFFFCSGASCDPFLGTSIGTDTSAAGGWSATWDTTAAGGDGAKRLGVRTIDNVGNVTDSAPRSVTVDNTPPTQTLSLSDQGTDGGKATSFISGTTLFYRGGAGAGRTLTVTSTVDGTGAPALNSTFTFTGAGSFAMAGTNPFTDSSAPFKSDTITWPSSETASPSISVASQDTALNTSTASALTFTNDSTAPTGQAFSLTGGTALTDGRRGYSSLGSPPAFSFTDGTDGSGTSGLGAREVEREEATLTNGVCGTFGTTTTLSAVEIADGDDDSIVDDKCYQYRFRIYDNVGNPSAYTAFVIAIIDTTAPLAAPSLSFGSFTNASATGTTVYVNPALAGGFTVTATTADDESGIRDVLFPVFGLGWTSPGAADTSLPYDGAYTFGVGATLPSGSQNVVSTNNTGLSPANGTFTVVADSTAPAATTVTCNGGTCSPGPAGWFTSSPVTIAATPGADGESGLGANPIYYTTDGSDPTTSSTNYTGAISHSTLGTTTYKFATFDTVGNRGPVLTQIVKLDTSAPTPAPTLTLTAGTNSVVSGSTVTFNGNAGGSFDITASGSSDPQSAVTYNFPSLGTGWTTSGSGATRTYTFTSSAADPTEPNNVTASNEAGLASAATGFTVTEDATSPTAVMTCNAGACAGTITTASVTVGVSSPDSDTVQLRYTINGAAPTASTGTVISGASGSFSVTAQGTITIQLIAVDSVGNVTSPVVSNTFTHDSNGPSLTSSALSGGNAVALTFNETLKSSVDGIPPTTAFVIKVNGVTRTLTPPVAISDSTATVTFTGVAAVASNTVTFEYTQPVTDPRLQDGAGNPAASIAQTTVGGTGGPAAAAPPPPPPPAPSITSGPQALSRSTGASFSFTSSSATSFECAIDGGGFAPCASPTAYSGLGQGSHSFSVRAIAGGATSSATSHSWTIDSIAPPLEKRDGPASLTVDTGPSFTFGSSEGGVMFYCTLDGTSLGSCVSPRSFSGLGLGDHTFTVYALDEAGNASGEIAWTFKIVEPTPNATAINTTVAEKASVPGEGGSVSTPDASVSMSWPASLAADGLLMTIAQPRIEPTTMPDVKLVDVVDAFARRLSDGTPVNSFPDPLTITFDEVPAQVAAMTSEDGITWRAIPRLDSAVLPAGMADGVFFSGGDAIVLTRHLSFFGLFSDAVAPTVPPLSGAVDTEGLTLSWQPSTDNSGTIGRYVLYVDGAPATTFSGGTLQAKLGAFSAADARVFQLAAEDGAGNRSPLSAALRGVPQLVGQHRDQARATLEARGLVQGNVTEQTSNQPTGTVLSHTPTAPGIVPAGTPVDIVVSGAGAGAGRFVLQVTAAKKIKLTQRKFIAVRVQVSKRAVLVSVLRTPTGEKVFRWKRWVKPGTTVLKLRLPKSVQRSGLYRLNIWAAGIGERQRILKKLRIRLEGSGTSTLGPTANPARRPIEIVLAGGPTRPDAALDLDQKVRVSHARTMSAAFAYAGGTGAPIDVLVVDSAREGLGIVRDFHLLFPEVKIVVIVDSPAQAARARWTGATSVILRSAPRSRLTAAIRASLP